MRTQVICGNWKMNNASAETTALIAGLRAKLDKVTGVEIGVAPPFPFLALAHEKLAGSPIKLSAQNVFWEKSGAYTGEVSTGMLKDVGCNWVIVGHSERRQYFGETDETVNKRIVATLNQGLTPIVCIGETLAERDAGKTLAVVETQLAGAFKNLSEAQLLKLVIAYEPVWAIGTGRVATPAQAQEVHAFIRTFLGRTSAQVQDSVRVLYGGSVKGDNAAELLAQPDIDGALVGGASIKADEFVKIVLGARGVQSPA